MSKNCNNCGTENSNSAKFCETCGQELESNKTTNHKKIIFLLIGIVVLLVIGISIVSMVSTTSTVTKDFGGISILVPEGSNFVESRSLPNYGYGGFILFENSGEHDNKVHAIMFSTVKGANPPSEVVLDRVEDGVSIYKDANGKNKYYIQRNVGDYTVNIIGGDLPLMLKMIKSVQINNPTLNI